MDAITYAGSLIDSYVDFGSPLAPYNFTSHAVYINDFTIKTRQLDYILTMISGVNYPSGIKINTSGNQTTNTYSFTLSGAPRLDATFQRSVPSPGRNKATIIAYEESVQVGTASYDYVFLQRAIPVTQTYNTTTNTIIGPLGSNSSTSVSVGQVIGLDKSASRGDDSSSNWVVLKYDPNSGGVPLTAVQGVDYTLSSGTLSSDRIAISFINSSYNYTVQNNCSGYSFNSNPYYNVALDTSPNNGSISHNFILFVPTYTNNVLFPKLDISMSVPAGVQLDTNPLKTYQNQPITVSAVVISNTGYWKLQAPSIPDTVVTKTDSEWETEMTNRCNITLQIKDKVTGAIITTRTGFGPYDIAIQDINIYTLLYVTTLK